MSRTIRHEPTEDRQAWRSLVTRANNALDRRQRHRQTLMALCNELGTATRAATAYDAALELGEAWGNVSDAVGW